MRVTQTISIGKLSINSMSNSSILQVGASGAIKTRSEEITEVLSQQQADQKLEQKVTQAVEPILKKEGLPVEPYVGGSPGIVADGGQGGVQGAPRSGASPPESGPASCKGNRRPPRCKGR
jgi:hypothetical protein